MQLLWYFEIQTDLLISARGPDLTIINKKKKKKKKEENLENCCPDWPQFKIERKWINISTLLGNWKNGETGKWRIYNLPIVIAVFGTVTEGLIMGREDLEIRGRMVTIQTPALLISVRILRRVLETWGDLLSLKLQEKNHQVTLM